MKILAIDLGKNKSVICMYDTETRHPQYGKLNTTPQAMHDLLVEQQPDRVVYENGNPSGWLTDLVEAFEVEYQVANTNHPSWRWSNVRKKNDREDALRLAQLSALDQLPLVHVPRKAVREKRALMHYRQSLVARRTQIKNHIRALLDREGRRWPAGKKGWTQKALDQLRQLSRPFGDTDGIWRSELRLELQQLESVEESLAAATAQLDAWAQTDEAVQLVQTSEGVGPRTAEMIVAVLDDPHRFKSGKQVGSYAGLTPKQYQSGQMDRQGRISGQGNRLLRSLLVECCWLGLRWNGWMRETYERIRRGSAARKKIAIVAVARKLLVRCCVIVGGGRRSRSRVLQAGRRCWVRPRCEN